MHDLLNVEIRTYPDVGAGVTTDLVDFGGSTGVVAVFNFPDPVEVKRFGLTVDDSELLDVGAGVVLALKKYLIPGSSTNAVTLGTITSTADIAKGAGMYTEFDLGDENGETGEDGSLRNVAPRDEDANIFIVNPGEQLVVDLTDAADTSGKGQVWVEVIHKGGFGAALVTAGYTKVTV